MQNLIKDINDLVFEKQNYLRCLEKNKIFQIKKIQKEIDILLLAKFTILNQEEQMEDKWKIINSENMFMERICNLVVNLYKINPNKKIQIKNLINNVEYLEYQVDLIKKIKVDIQDYKQLLKKTKDKRCLELLFENITICENNYKNLIL